VRLAALLFVAACFSPSAKPGAPCSPTGQCPSGLVCAVDGLCQLPGTLPMGDAPQLGSDATMINVDAPIDGLSAPSNDLSTNPMPITGDTTITEDIRAAHDDTSAFVNGGGNSCGAAGGKDVFFTIDVAADELWYLDTFGSDFPNVIRIYSGSCKSGVAPNGTSCIAGACGTQQSQIVHTMTAGTNCVIVDQDGASANGSLVLHVERGHRLGTRIPVASGHLFSGTTCGAATLETGSCGGSGYEVAYYATSCPGTTRMLTATTCSAATTYDSVLYVRGAAAAELACNDNDAACSATLSGASTVTNVGLSDGHLFWLFVDSAGAGACGAYSLTTTLQ